MLQNPCKTLGYKKNMVYKIPPGGEVNHIQPVAYNDIGPVKQKKLRKIAIIFLSIRLNICFGCSKEPSHRDGSFEYPQHMYWLQNKKNNFQLHTLIWMPAMSHPRLLYQTISLQG